MKNVQEQLAAKQSDWHSGFENWKSEYPDLAAELMSCYSKDLPDLINDSEFWSFEGSQATRAASGTVLNRLSNLLPNLIGGSADLAPSTKTELKGKGWFASGSYESSNIHFGVREFAMAAAANGMSLHGGLRPFCSTFFVFSDYLKAALRLSAIMKIPVLYVLTHDSIGVGEDGPTHEPIEHLTALRATPDICVFRPADGKETAAGYIAALSYAGPTCMVLSRQNLPTYENSGKGALKGGYILSDAENPQLILMASGSEVELVMNAQKILLEKGVAARVVSMPSMELFEAQDDEYKESVLPSSIRARLAVEAGATLSWYRYVGLDGKVIGLDRFGASAPASILFKEFGFTTENVVNQAVSLL